MPHSANVGLLPLLLWLLVLPLRLSLLLMLLFNL
jgi:hypothetical protein